MAFQFKADECLSRGVRRIVRKQIDKALRHLSGQTRSAPEAAVHETRKCIKRVRAVLRLVRKELGTECYARENTRLRDAAQPLSKVRDAQVLVESVGHLTEHYPNAIPGVALDAIREALSIRRRRIFIRKLEHQDALAAAGAILDKVQAGTKQWKVRRNWPVVRVGLRRIYRQGQKAFAVAVGSSTTDSMHRLRKRVKDLAYQLELLEPMRPDFIKCPKEQAERLADCLGDEHDLAVLHEVVLDDESIDIEPVALGQLLTLIERRRAELQDQAIELAHHVYLDKPRHFVRRLERFWHAWRAGTEPPRVDPATSTRDIA